MKTRTYRVSNVEAFRQWECDDEAELADIITKIAGKFEPSPAMRAGTAFHKALELACTGIAADSIEAEGYTFNFATDMDVELSPIREVRASKTYMVDGLPITISGQIDQIDGHRIDDHKTTVRFDPDRYLDGYQWRLYLDIFGAHQFRWNVFEIAEAEEPACYNVRAAHRLEQFRYPRLEADCQAMVECFARFVRAHVEDQWTDEGACTFPPEPVETVDKLHALTQMEDTPRAVALLEPTF